MEADTEHAGTLLDAVFVVVCELLFVILPLVVVLLVVLHKHKPIASALASPEWSVASAILFGQAAVKMISVAASGAAAERASLLGGVAIVVGLVPSLTLLTFMLDDEASSAALSIPQFVVFVFSVATYLFFATIAEYTHRHAAR